MTLPTNRYHIAWNETAPMYLLRATTSLDTSTPPETELPAHVDGYLRQRYTPELRQRPTPPRAPRQRRWGLPEAAALALCGLAIAGAYWLLDALLRALLRAGGV